MNIERYILLIKGFEAGGLSDMELTELFNMLNSPEGLAEYDRYLSRQQETDSRNGVIPLCPNISAETMLANIRRKTSPEIMPDATSLDHGSTSLDRNSTVRIYAPTLLKYAAIALILILAGSLAYMIIDSKMQTPNSDVVFAVAKGNKGTLKMSDGSEVWLNAESSIKYNAVFQREIQLDGEAYLNVATNPKRPFTVKTVFGDVKVYGTKFEVTAYSRDSVFDVALLKGCVGLEIPGQEKVMLKPGQKARFDVRTNELTLIDMDMRDAALWRQNELRLDNADSETLRRRMSAWYSLDISIETKPAIEPKYNMTIRHESFEDMMELIRKVTPIKYEVKGKD
ncbi:MAG: FecR domain-containing protein, partial [Tannerella sp.]|nr:FecR domain-containing protein [Tannerella sp.]